MHACAFSEYGGPEVLRWQQLPDPEPGAGEVTIAVAACGVNHLDLDSRQGLSPWDYEFPHVLGGEFAGTIAALGPGVEGWSVGDPVTAEHQYACGKCDACLRWHGELCPNYTFVGNDSWGAYGELVRIPARLLIALDSIEQAPIAASAQVAVSTAWSMVYRLAAIRPLETVLVPSASGGVGSSLVQCAKLAGARVIASVGAAAKVERVRALGADEVFVHTEVAPSAAVAELTGGAGVDAVLDNTAGPLLGEHLACLRIDGRLAFCGAHAGVKVRGRHAADLRPRPQHPRLPPLDPGRDPHRDPPRPRRPRPRPDRPRVPAIRSRRGARVPRTPRTRRQDPLDRRVHSPGCSLCRLFRHKEQLDGG